MNDTNCNGNGKITYNQIGRIFVVITGTVAVIIWLMTSLSAKADKTEIEVLKSTQSVMESRLVRMETKLDILLERK